MNLELSRIKIDLERANKWTKSSMIITHLGNNTRNIRIEIGYEQPMIGNSLLCITCDNSGHFKENCPKYKISAENKARGIYETVQKIRYIPRKSSLPK